MANSWFRLYSEFAHDPKVQTMPAVFQRHLVMLFCLRSEGKPLSRYTDEEIAYYLQVTALALPEIKSTMLQKGFIDEKWNVTNWDKRQFLSDSSTARTRQYRKRMKQSGTSHETPVTATVTAPDTDTDTEQKQKEQRPSRVKREGEKSKTALADERHQAFKAQIEIYWKSKNPELQMTWDGREGKALGMFLSATPQLTVDQFTEFLRHRFKSEVNHSVRPAQWIGTITNFASGPIDRYGKPISAGGHTNGTSRPVRGSSGLSDEATRNAEALAAQLRRDRENASRRVPVPA